MNIEELLASASLDGRRTGPAVFALEHRLSGRRLIVGTRCLSKRLCDQRRYLRQRQHHNPEVQVDLLTGGADAFSFVLLEVLSDVSLLPYFKRLHATAAQTNKGCYNPADPPSRRLLSVECNSTFALGSMQGMFQQMIEDKRLDDERARQKRDHDGPANPRSW